MLHDLFDFVDRHRGETKQTFIEMPYMHDLCRVLEDCVTGNLPDGKRNLAITIPPRHYKTTFVSQALPAWCFAEISDDCEFILTSATEEIAVNNAVQVRQILDSEWYAKTYPHVQISKEERDAQHYFRTTTGGAIYAAGLSGTITSFGAGKTRRHFGGAVIIDDPLKADDAFSRVMRQHCINFYLHTLTSRRNSIETPFILIMQRLHLDDLVGWIEKNEPDEWHIHSFPALDEITGEVLNPVTTSRKELMRLKETAPSVYYAQYQQKPDSDASQVIDVSRLSRFDGDLSRITGRSFITIDSAMSTKEYADRSVISKWRANEQGLYHLGSVFGRWDFPQLLDNTRQVYNEFHKSSRGRCEIYVEDRVSGTSLYQTLRDEMRVYPWRPSEFRFPESKQGRVQHSLPMLYSGKCVFTTQTPREMFDEFHYFRNDMSHEHDDFVDTVTMACSLWLYWGGRVI